MSTAAERAAALDRLRAIPAEERRARLLPTFRRLCVEAGLAPERLVTIDDVVDSGLEGRVRVEWFFDPPLTEDEWTAYEAVLQEHNRRRGGRPIISPGEA